MKVYLAASWRDRIEARELMEGLKQAGFEVTHDWTRPGERTIYQQARLDLEKIKDADVLIVHEPSRVSKGKYTEMGIALGLDKPIIIYNNLMKEPFPKSYIFSKLKYRFIIAKNPHDMILALKVLQFGQYGSGCLMHCIKCVHKTVASLEKIEGVLYRQCNSCGHLDIEPVEPESRGPPENTSDLGIRKEALEEFLETEVGSVEDIIKAVDKLTPTEVHVLGSIIKKKKEDGE